MRVGRRDLICPQLAVAFFVVLKLTYGLLVPPNSDEAYYFLWGAHPQLSYFDHAPMVGWASGLSGLAFGWTVAGLRLPAVVTFAVLIFALSRYARWVAPADPARHFWIGLAIFVASPLMAILTTLNYPDHLLLCFSTLSLLQLGRYLGDVIARGDGRLVDLYTGAFWLGLAGLSKYNAVFIAAGLVVILFGRPELRRLLRSPHLYLAGLLTLALIAPVAAWNAQHHFASLEFHTLQRFNPGGHIDLLGLLRVVLLSVLTLSPFLIVGFWRFLTRRTGDSPLTGFWLLGRWATLISAVVFLPLAASSGSSSQVSPHWLALGFLPFLLVAPLFIRSRLAFNLHLGWGALVMTVATVYFVLSPLATDAVGIKDREATRTFGFEQVAAAVERAAAEHGATLYAAESYGSAAKLAFALGSDRDVLDLSRRTTQIQLWRDDLGDRGADVIIFAPGNAKPEHFEDLFQSVEYLGPLQTTRFGRPLMDYRLLLGRGYKP